MFSNRKLLNLIVPLFLDQLLLLGVMFLSTIMIAQSGAGAVSGVSLVDMLNGLILNILVALAVGGSVVISQYIGSKQDKNAEHAAAQLINISVLTSLIISLLLWLFGPLILNFLFGSVEPAVMANIRLYYLLSIVSFPFYALYQASNAIFRAIGNTRIPLLSSLMMNVLNFIGNTLSLMVLDLGVFGVGMSAILARLIAAVFVFILVIRKNAAFRVIIRHIFSFHKTLIQRILSIAVPNSIENGVLNLGRLLLASLVSGLGTAQIAANGIANSLAPLAVSFGIAMSLAISTVVGQTVGANDYAQAKSYIRKLMLWTYLGNLLVIAVHTLTLPMVLSFYQLSEEISGLAWQLIFIHNTAAVFLFPLGLVLPPALRGAGDAKFTMTMSILAMLIFRMGAAYFFTSGLGWGVTGIWVAMVFDWVFRTIAFTLRYRSSAWMRFRVV